MALFGFIWYSSSSLGTISMAIFLSSRVTVACVLSPWQSQSQKSSEQRDSCVTQQGRWLPKVTTFFERGNSDEYPLVNITKTMENPHV